jgi:hypothetical protein
MRSLGTSLAQALGQLSSERSVLRSPQISSVSASTGSILLWQRQRILPQCRPVVIDRGGECARLTAVPDL